MWHDLGEHKYDISEVDRILATAVRSAADQRRGRPHPPTPTDLMVIRFDMDDSRESRTTCYNLGGEKAEQTANSSRRANVNQKISSGAETPIRISAACVDACQFGKGKKTKRYRLTDGVVELTDLTRIHMWKTKIRSIQPEEQMYSINFDNANPVLSTYDSTLRSFTVFSRHCLHPLVKCRSFPGVVRAELKYGSFPRVLSSHANQYKVRTKSTNLEDLDTARCFQTRIIVRHKSGKGTNLDEMMFE